MVDLKVVKPFAELFQGRDDAYGLAAGLVVKQPLRQRAYNDHLNGLIAHAIGVFPLCDDGTVRFAAIDLDEPNFELAGQIEQHLPGRGWIERSRSGNAHIWVFFSEPCDAWVARGRLRLALERVERPDVEIFPKQATLREGMVGNYINLPFYGDTRPMLSPYDEPGGGSELDLGAFVRAATRQRIDPTWWKNLCYQAGIEPPSTRDTVNSEWHTLATPHSCALYMLEHKEDSPLAPGHRHVVLFNLAKMLLNCADYGFEETLSIVSLYNEAGVEPVSDGEVRSLVTNALRGQWTSTGCDDPIMQPYVSPDCRIAHG